jgi:hypothetical protein
MDLSKRSNARYPSDLKVEVHTGPVGGLRLGEGVIIDLSLSGCLLRTTAALKAGATYRLRARWSEGDLDLPCRMAREAGRSAKDPAARHYGLAFNLTYDQEKALMRLIDVVRRSEQAGGGGFMSNYW